MAFHHTSSAESLKSELDLWVVPPTQTAVESGQWVVFKPLTSLDDASSIDFVIPGTGNEYLDPAHTLLYVKCKIVKADGSDIKSTDSLDVAPVNYLLHSMWSQVDVSLGQKVISQSSMTYAYRAYLEALLAYDGPAKDSHLSTRLWYKDTAGKFDSLEDNDGLEQRRELTKNSQVFEMIGNIHADFFNQDRYLINNVEMRLKFTRNKDAFMLMSSKDEKLKILDATLYVRKVRLSPSILIAHAKALEVSPAKYPVTRVDIKTVTISSGLQDKSIDNLHLGAVPKRIIIGFVDNKAFNSDYKSNPFNFKHFDLNYLSLFVDAQQIPTKPLTPDFEKGEFIECYHSLFSGSGIHFKDEGNAINRTDYPAGTTLYAFDLTPDQSASEGYWNLQRQGTVRLEVRFAKPLASAVNCIVFSEFTNLIEIDRHRGVVIDFTT